MIHRPNAAGLFLCEQVIVEEHTRKLTFVNCFNRLQAEHFPTPARRFYVCAYLRDGLGETTLRISATRLDTLDEVYSRSFQVNFTDRIRIYRVYWPVSDLEFPDAGHYQLRLLIGEEQLADCLVELRPR
jgi:hypothetical protein